MLDGPSGLPFRETNWARRQNCSSFLIDQPCLRSLNNVLTFQPVATVGLSWDYHTLAKSLCVLRSTRCDRTFRGLSQFATYNVNAIEEPCGTVFHYFVHKRGPDVVYCVTLTGIEPTSINQSV
jgi:hypothetical protein